MYFLLKLELNGRVEELQIVTFENEQLKSKLTNQIYSVNK